jgi:uncharacterized protein
MAWRTGARPGTGSTTSRSGYGSGASRSSTRSCPAQFSWDVIAGFAPGALDLTRLKLAVTTPRLACSDNDPYFQEGAAEVFGRPLGCDVDLLTGAGHVAIPDGYGPWPSVLEWCLDPAARLKAN